jgi:type IV secretory pathway TrbL component
VKKALFVLVVAVLLTAAALIAGASARSLIEEGAQKSPTETTGQPDDSNLDPIVPADTGAEVESESDKAARQLDMVVIALVVLALVVAVVTFIIWRRSKPVAPANPPSAPVRTDTVNSGDTVNSQDSRAG